MMKLKIVSTPDKALVYSNAVYVSKRAFGVKKRPSVSEEGVKEDDLVLVDGVAFSAKVHDGVEDGTVALSLSQRLTVKRSLGVSVDVVLPWTSGRALTHLKFEVDNALKQRVELREDDLVAHVRASCAGSPFTEGQIFLLNYKGAVLQCVVQSCSVGDDSAAGSPHSDSEEEEKGEKGEKKTLKKEGSRLVVPSSTCGILQESTEVEIVAVKNRLLVWTKSKTSRPALIRHNWKFEEMGIGGLDDEFASIFRRAFASRLFPPAVIAELGIQHVKGMLLYGPPGTGKTLIARQIGKMLANREPVVVNGPSILNKFVGQSEENVRNLFSAAEKDFKENGEHADLHIIILDEIDALCKQRGSGAGAGVHDTIVNQLLTKIDGVDSLPNVLLIGMTNRKDMLDSALLRPGRLEVHVEIGLPDEEGRQAIFGIHTKKMAQSSRLAPDVNLAKLAERTKNFSGAEIEGLVKAASSFALYGALNVSKGTVAAPKKDMSDILITNAHFERAFGEVIPMFGVQEDAVKNLVRGELYDFGPEYQRVLTAARTAISQVRNSETTHLISVLIQGKAGTGKTAVAASLALESKFPFVKLISPELFLGSSESSKVSEITKVFEDSYKSPFSLVILDEIERLLEYVPVGPRFSNTILQTLLVVLKRIPPVAGRKLLILATTSSEKILKDMKMRSAFNLVLTMPQLATQSQVARVLQGEIKVDSTDQLDKIAAVCPVPIGIKQLLVLADMARRGESQAPVSCHTFQECVLNSGLSEADDDE